MGYAEIIFLTNIIQMAEKYLKNGVYQHFEWGDLITLLLSNVLCKPASFGCFDPNLAQTDQNHKFVTKISPPYQHQTTSFKVLVYTIFQVLFSYLYDVCQKKKISADPIPVSDTKNLVFKHLPNMVILHSPHLAQRYV